MEESKTGRESGKQVLLGRKCCFKSYTMPENAHARLEKKKEKRLMWKCTLLCRRRGMLLNRKLCSCVSRGHGCVCTLYISVYKFI